MADSDQTLRKFSFSWYIENFFSYFIFDRQLLSPSFLSVDYSEWSVQIAPDCMNEKISCNLHRKSKTSENQIFFVDVEIKLLNEEKIEENREELKNIEFKENDVFFSFKYLDKFQNLLLSFTIKTDLPKNVAVGCEMITKITTKTPDLTGFMWNIRNNISQIKKTFFLDSSSFEMEVTKSEDIYTIIVNQLGESPFRIVKGRIGILNLEKLTFGEITEIHDFRDGFWKFPELDLKLLGLKILPDEMFILACEFNFDIKQDEPVRYSFDSQTDLPKKCLVVLEKNMQHLSSVNEQWDVLLKVENENIPAHKHILANQSPFFLAMFEQDKPKRDIVTISKVDITTMTLFLNFIYCENVKFVTYESCVKLFLVSDEYKVLKLRDKCVDYLKSVLTKNNVCEILVMTDIYKCDLLKESALNYLTENYEHIVIKPEWLQWIEMNTKFSSDILSNLAHKIYREKTTKFKDSEEVLCEFVSCLLKYGADPNICLEYNHTLFEKVTGVGLHKITHLLLKWGVLPTFDDLEASFNVGDLAVIEALLQRGAPVSREAKHCDSALHHLVRSGSMEKTFQLCKLLMKYGAEIDFENECYNTPLFFATDAEDVESSMALLHYGAQPCYKCPRFYPLERSFIPDTNREGFCDVCCFVC